MSESRGRAATILLAEDDPGDIELTRRAFESGRLRNDLRVVQDGEEAIDYLFRRNAYKDPESSPRPDLLLLDLNLPKKDGRDVLRQIRAHPDLKRLAVVVLTTSDQEKDIIESYDLGVNSYITKPDNMEDFVASLRTLEDYWFQVVVLPPGERA